ncbi:hypothetical protein [Erythrobacter sp.]|jgi:hypothetical protein|uniref:hypothetical protein n=1 Tax=Erythrobacter sp. TaxID=1042 RepID=UPI002EB352F5|nr:hypothetical protein [Erythrobacter sp.]
MSAATIVYLVLGLAGFGLGAYLAATGDRTTGIVLMAAGLAFQLLTLRQLKLAKRGGGRP